MKFYQAFYTVIKFVPDLVRNEPINIGLIVHCPQEGYIRTDFSDKKANNIIKYNSDIDPNAVKLIMQDLKQNYDNEKFILRNQKMGNFYDDKLLYKIFAAHSNQLQFTKPRSLITDNLEQEFKRLFKQLVFNEIMARKEQVVEERTMKSKIRKEFNKYGLIEKQIVKENHIEIDRFGDEIKIDFKFVNGKPNLIKNISLDTRTIDPMNHAKLWLKNYEIIKEGTRHKGRDNKIHLIYCLPTDDRKTENNKIISCLKEASDELIDYRDEEKVDHFIKEVVSIAHN